MAGVSAVISSLINLAANLLPEVKNTFFAASSSSSAQAPDAHALEADLKRLMRMLERIKATLHDAERRNVRDKSVRLWLKELKELAHEAENVLDEYMYEVYSAQVEARNINGLNPQKRKTSESCAYFVKIPANMGDSIKGIISRFEEIARDREALCLREDDAPRRYYNETRPTPTSPLVVEQNIIGREEEKQKVINLLLSDYEKGKIISVLPIVGKGGLGKTTLAQLVYNDKRIHDSFDMLGWVCVSDDFNIERITRDIIESLTRTGCDLKNPSVLLEELAKIVKGKRVFIVLDDVWNEERGPWELLHAPLMEAKVATILVTTRNTSVARIMQTMVPLELAYLSDDYCWLLFARYAFENIDPSKKSDFVEIGKEIVKKCGGFPLAVKSIASLLRYEKDAQSWVEILQSDLWELDTGKEILAPLQISYERLPMYLKQCLLLCSMFPKDCKYGIDLMSRLWIANGYIEPKENKNPEEVAVDYAKELHERSFFDDFKEKCSNYRGLMWGKHFRHRDGSFKLHDMVHDLAWLNSEKTCCSDERGISKKICHLYLSDESGLGGLNEILGSINIPILQTLVTRSLFSLDARYRRPISCLSRAECLRALDLEGIDSQLPSWHPKHLRYLSLDGYRNRLISPQFLFAAYNLRILILDFPLCDTEMELEGIGNLINLEFLQLHHIKYRKLPESLCFLIKLRVLEIYSSKFDELPKCTGNLENLQRIVIIHTRIKQLPESFCMLTNLKELIFLKCHQLRALPKDFGKLTSLRFLLLECPEMQYLPLSCSKLIPKCTMNVSIGHKAQPYDNNSVVGWLKEFNDLKGILWIKDIRNILSLEDAKNANLISKSKLETLLLDYGTFRGDDIGRCYNKLCKTEYLTGKDRGEMEISICCSSKNKSLNFPDHVLEIFQPHPNLKNLYIGKYHEFEFPRWMGDPLSCASLIKLCIRRCSSVKFLPLGNVLSLKQLHVDGCGSLLHLKMESLPSQLEDLSISECWSLVEVAMLQSLIKLHISSCDTLRSLLMTDGQHRSELKSLPALKEMTIEDCPLIEANQLLPGEDCAVHISNCPNLKDWCLQHNFEYMDTVSLGNSYEDGDNDDYEETLKQIMGLLDWI